MGAYQFAAFLSGTDVHAVKKEFWAQNKDNAGELLRSLTSNAPSPPEEIVEFEDIREVPVEQPSENVVDFGDEWVDYTKNEYAKRVIESRHIFDAPFIPDNWKFYYDKKSNRLVIPWIRDGEMVYYQLRALIKSPQKYMFPKDIQKDVFGLDNLDENLGTFYICEGVFDSIFTINCLAIGGLKLSEHQQKLIQNKTSFLNQVYFPDNQWQDQSSMKSSIEFAKTGGSIFIWPKEFLQKDVNDFVLQNKVNPFSDICFMKQNTYTGVKALIKLKFKR
jgi:hypothetical protein